MSLGSACGQMGHAKEAVDHARYANGDEPRQTLMGAASRAVELQGDRIGDVLSTVDLFLDRFFGPQPDSGSATSTPTPQPSGIIHELDRNLSRNNYLLDALQEKIKRLGDIA